MDSPPIPIPIIVKTCGDDHFLRIAVGEEDFLFVETLHYQQASLGNKGTAPTRLRRQFLSPGIPCAVGFPAR